uniref:Uncharacterized protein n=1 Tax=Parascaris univalens TaxID=6257 RepID=A0A914ZKC4_PARUN
MNASFLFIIVMAIVMHTHSKRPVICTFNFECSAADMCIDGFCKQRGRENVVRTVRHCSFAPWCIPSIHDCKHDWCPLGQICNTASSLCE